MNLRKKFEAIVEDSAALIRTLPWENRDFYTQWLAQQYFLVSHTPRLLCAFALRVPIENREEFAEIMHHLKEENGHDLWLLSDMEKMGVTPSQFKPNTSSQAMIKTQYYQIQHDEPISLCGYSQFLEYLSAVVAGELAGRVEKSFGKKVAVFLTGHSKVDVEHAEDGWKMISRANEKQQKKILENLELTYALYTNMLNQLRLETENKTSHFKAA